MGMGRDWQIEFRLVHAWIFRGPAAALGYPNCEEGWPDRLERRCTRIAACRDGRRLQALQTKEKFGALQFYWSDDFPGAANAKIDEAIALAAARSACTDETRGAEAASTTAADAHDRVPRTCRRRTQAYQAGIREHPHRPDLRPPAGFRSCRPDDTSARPIHSSTSIRSPSESRISGMAVNRRAI